MESSCSNQLEEQFYRWETRGRGWFLWDAPVLPEPPFRPFIGFYGNPPDVDAENASDDGRSQTIVSGLLNWLHQRVRNPFGRKAVPVNEEPEEPLPDYWEYEQEPVELRVNLSDELKVTPELAEQCLLSISGSHHPVGFEFVGTHDSLNVQFVCDQRDQDSVHQQLSAHFHGSTLTRAIGTMQQAWSKAGEERVIAEFGLGREFMLPLASASRSFVIDPLLGILAALGDADAGEVAMLQVLFHPVRYPWSDSALRAVTFADGSPVFTGNRDYVAGAREKTSRPLYAAVLRVAAKSNERDRCISLIRGVAGAFSAFADPDGNELIPLDNEGYDPDEHEADLLHRRSRRGGMLLSSSELVSLVHLPSSNIQLPKLRPKRAASKPAPSLVLNKPCVIGINEHSGKSVPVGLSAEQRARHLQVIGASGTGKSTLLLNMIAQDMKAGDGVAVFDPHGDLVDAVLRLVPPERTGDVILLDPSDDEFPIGFNVLSAHSSMEKDLLASDLVAVFRRLATSWGDQMNSVLGNGILAFLESERGGTLGDLRRFLVEPAFRKEFLRTVRDPEVVYYWQKEFPLLTGRPQGPVLTRLDTFLRPKPIRNMVAQKESRLNFGDILDGGKILLARLSHGAIGAENAYLLGGLLVSKLHQLALGRQRMREEDRRFFWLYMDEFHQFATPSMAAILTGARKYRLGLILAHQELQQLDSLPEVASAVANTYTRICFRLSDQDGKKLESGFAGFSASDLQNLGTGEAICRVERAELDFNLKTTRPPQVSDEHAQRLREEIVRLTRERYAVPRAEVEAVLARARGVEDEGNSSSPPPKTEPPRTPEPPQNIPTPSTTATASFASLGIQHGEVSITRPQEATPPPSESNSSPGGPAPAPLPGRGGPQHQYLQQMIKQWAEGMGFKATIEGKVLGTQAADVAMEKQDLSIACELCVTTGFVHELGNVRKCLDAGFTHVAAISPEPDRLAGLHQVVEQQLDDAELERVHFCTPDQFFDLVRELNGSAAPDKSTMRGYKITTSYKTLTASEAAARQQQVSAVIAQAMRRLNQP